MLFLGWALIRIYLCSDEQIHAQIDVMNDSFDLAGFDWELGNITRTVNPKWFTHDLDIGSA